ncbi:ribonuclease H-like protein [Xylaria telfairii]|nr:ribonuclease H-like protein [Xylaria telfairii]
MPTPYNHDQHALMDETDSAGERPKHNPHRGGKPGGSCNRFPRGLYLDKEALCGVGNLEICGFSGFMHARCPWASTVPCLCGRHSLHVDSLIVAVDGACPGNGSDRATKSACGVYFGPDMSENLAFRVPDTPEYSHTSQRAELSAALAAIQASHIYVYDGGQWPCDDCVTPCTVIHLVIKSDSAYLVNGMTAHVEKWRENGWRTTKNTAVKNQDLWTRLYDLVRLLYTDKGVSVDFWLVPRDQNKDADRLANWGLEELV